MTKTLNTLAVVLLGVLTLLGQPVKAQSKADEILGKWTNQDKTRVLEFVKSGSKYEAVVKKAPDKQLEGQKQLTGLVFNTNSYKGMLYLPKRGKTIPCTIVINKDGTMTLTAKAGFFSQSQTWVKSTD